MDIGSAYLEAYTSKKVYIIAGPEFGDGEGHILVISNALYGLQKAEPDGTIDSPTASENLDSSHVRQNPTSG
jgi:hypothetical protein